VVSNAATQVLMRQAPQAIDAVTDAFGLTAGEARLLLAARQGEALLVAGTNRVAFRLWPPRPRQLWRRTCLTSTNSEALNEANSWVDQL
jgi:hypothetical protein